MLNSIAERKLNQKLALVRGRKCDKYDYLVAVGCGAIGGIIDIFLVGSPGESAIGVWSDQQVDNLVMAFASKIGWSPRAGNEHNVRSAIGFLENGSQRSGFGGFKVNYDQATGTAVGNAFKMAPKNHHMLSLAHSPDIVGLFFSILNQFTSTSTFIANGQLITIETGTYELRGSNLIAKLFCGIANWFGHIMSDIAGSSGSVQRGSGVVIPFYELFGFCKFGKFRVGNDINDLSTLAVKAFQEGYDFRFGMATAIPVIITDLSIRLIWALRRHYQFEKPLAECIPSNQYSDLRIMLLVGNGTLCAIDGFDAAIRSHGNALLFFCHLNIIAWFKLALMVFKEISLRFDIICAELVMRLKCTLGIAYSELKEQFQCVNEALDEYLAQLKAIDYARYEIELKEIRAINAVLEDENAGTDRIYQYFSDCGIEIQFHSSEEFDQKMQEENFVLEI